MKAWENVRIVMIANKLRMFYGHPVYLVGSAIDKEFPRDVDLVIELPDKEFVTRYAWNVKGFNDTIKVTEIINNWINSVVHGINCDDVVWNWGQDCSKKSLQAIEFCQYNIDFKVHPVSYCKQFFDTNPKKKVDTGK